MKHPFTTITLLILFMAFTLFLFGCEADSKPPLPLITDGLSNYTIVRGDSADKPAVDAALALRRYIKERGVELPITTDWEGNPTSDYEIIVGETEREGDNFYTADRIGLGEEGFVIKVVGTKILITGGGDTGTVRGVDYFIRTYLGGESADPLLHASIPSDTEYSERQVYPIASFTLDGTPLGDYAIFCESPNDRERYATALTVRDLLYAYTGAWLEITDSFERGKDKVLLIGTGQPSGAGSFDLRLENGTLLADTDILGGIDRGFRTFLTEIIDSEQKDFRMEDGYMYTTDKVSTIYYSEFGAVGDGVTDDFAAIIAAHHAANAAGLTVRADAGATYYIGGSRQSADIQTNTDWGDAKFIIDDTAVENRGSAIFKITSKLEPVKITEVQTLAKHQEKLNLSLDRDSFIVVTDNGTMRYIREGLNQNNGSAQTDVFTVDASGKIDMTAPILWDYEAITAMTAYPIDVETLTVTGGSFTTIANGEESKYNYYARGIAITRSNTVIDGINHAITGEGKQGAPYGGFITISSCTNVTVQNSRLSGHKIYQTIGSAGSSVSMGSYDIQVNKATNVTILDCEQINDIHDTTLWGIFASNYSKNITFDGVVFSRFDAHMGVANATIRNSVLGHQGINIIGSGTFLIENSTVTGTNFISMRSDYGSTWEGELIIRDCVYRPKNGAKSDAVILSGSYSGQHDFGYTCYMPRKITIDGLTIDDRNPPEGYTGPKLLAFFNKNYTSDAYQETYPYVLTEEIVLSNLTVQSGKPYKLSENTYMFRNVRLNEQ